MKSKRLVRTSRNRKDWGKADIVRILGNGTVTDRDTRGTVKRLQADLKTEKTVLQDETEACRFKTPWPNRQLNSQELTSSAPSSYLRLKLQGFVAYQGVDRCAD
jgi:hypothetical protein